MTKQEAFDRVWQHFVVERKPPAMHPEGGCSYRNPDGHRCAVGLLFPEDMPDEIAEYRYQAPSMLMEPRASIQDYAREHLALSDEDALTRFYGGLQACHDDAADTLGDAAFSGVIRELLADFARHWDLKVPPDA